MENQIYNESCHNTLDRMPPGFIDAVVTSPPYGNMRDYASGLGDGGWDFELLAAQLKEKVCDCGVVCWIVRDQRKNWDYSMEGYRQAEFFRSLSFKFFQHIVIESKITIPGSSPIVNSFQNCFCFCNGKKPAVFGILKKKSKTTGKINIQTPKESKALNAGIDRVTTCGEHRRMTDVFRIDDDSMFDSEGVCVWRYPGGKWVFRGGASNIHPATTPYSIVARLIHTFSKPGGLIYDPFNGCGTVTLEAKIAGRKWCGSEIVEEYHNVAMGRMGMKYEPPPGQKGFDFGEKNE